MGDPQGFRKFSRIEAGYRSVEERVRDWREIYEALPDEKLKDQAARCMDCGVPFCQSSTGCPVDNLIPEWNDLVQKGHWKEALSVLHSTNNFPEFTGKLCPAPCESACVLGIGDKPVTIRAIEMGLIDWGFREGVVRPIQRSAHSYRSNPAPRVAIVGSGPAGLAAAQQLCRAGYQVTVFEKADRLGGLLRYGIPDFKLEKWVLDRRLDQMRAEGVLFETGVEVGKFRTIQSLRNEFVAIGLAVGAEQARDIEVPGRNLKGIHFAMDFLTQQNQMQSGVQIPEDQRISAKGKRVVILGGGDTGSDCLGTVHRQGALEVQQFEILPKPPNVRSESTPWPRWPLQLRTSHAQEEGGTRIWEILTTGFKGEEGQLKAVLARTCWDAECREVEIQADLVLLALGFSGVTSSPLLQELGIQVGPNNTIPTDHRYRTSAEGVFAAGDARRGASLIVWAIAEGRKMAAAIDSYISRKLVKRFGSSTLARGTDATD